MNTPEDHSREATPERDDEFEAALRARRRFVPRFDDVDDYAEPSPELDRRVLARAREALRDAPADIDTRTAARGAPDRHYRGPRWAVPLALVATVLLSFTLLLQLDPARNDTVLAPRADAPAASVLAEHDAGGASMSAPANSAAPASEAIAVEQASVDGRRMRGLEANAPTQTRTAPSYAPAPAPAPAASPPDASPLAASPPAAPPPPAAAAISADAATNAAPPSEVAGYAATRGAALEAESRERATARREAAPLRDALQKASDTSAAKSAASAAAEDPQTWLARIERLRSAGDLDAARAQLAEFRRVHPEIELPPALRDLR